MNDRLRGALAQKQMTVGDLAKKAEVNVKSVERWLTTPRQPHPRTRRLAAEALGVSPDYLWPDTSGSNGLHRDLFAGAANAQSEIISTYPNRAAVTQTVWQNLLNNAEKHIDILVFSGTFLNQTNPDFPAMVADRAAAGAQVRLCFGDPDGSAVELRGEEEGIGSTLGAKIRASLSYFTSILQIPGCEVRLHNATLYASIFRYDQEAMVNPHIWGKPASANPLLHLRDVGPRGMFAKYASSFEDVWERSVPWAP